MALDPTAYATNKGYGPDLFNYADDDGLHNPPLVTLAGTFGGMNLVQSNGVGQVQWSIFTNGHPIPGMPLEFPAFLASFWAELPVSAPAGNRWFGIDGWGMWNLYLDDVDHPEQAIYQINGIGLDTPPGPTPHRGYAASNTLNVTTAPTHFLAAMDGTTHAFSLAVNGAPVTLTVETMNPATDAVGLLGFRYLFLQLMNGGLLGDVWASDTPAYVDATDPAIIAKFIGADGFPVPLGADGSTPFGTIPPLFYSLGTTVPVIPPDFPLVGVHKVLLPSAELQFADANGAPYAGGTLDTFVLGTTTPKTTWIDSAGDTENENPIRLDAAGRCIIYGNGGYRTVLKDSAGNLIWDQPSYTYVSVAMLPVVGAATLADAREAMGITDAIEAEAVARAAADSAEATARAAADTAEATARAAADSAEAAARVAGDAALQAEIDALPPALVSNVQGSYGQVGADGHARITFAVAFTALSSVVVAYKGVGFGSNTLTIGNEDRFGFDIWITQAGTPIPKPNELFYYLALGT